MSKTSKSSSSNKTNKSWIERNLGRIQIALALNTIFLSFMYWVFTQVYKTDPYSYVPFLPKE